jgi:hypothetical protein
LRCCDFNQAVDNLPKNLTHLNFGFYFNKPVHNLPKNLIHLTFNMCYKQPIYNLPKKLNYLDLFYYRNNDIILPTKIKELCLFCNNNLINNLPEHIEILHIYFSANTKNVHNLPTTLKEIIVEKEKYLKYIKIPFGTKISFKKFRKYI